MPVLITAERLDFKESLARNENKRVRNRLELSKGTLTEHESTNLSSMNYEMRRLKHELKGIKQTSGYLIVNKETSGGLEKGNLAPRSKRRHNSRVLKKKKHRVTQDVGCMPRVEEKSVLRNKDLVKTNKLPFLQNIPHNTSETNILGCEKGESELSNTSKIPDISNVNRTLDTTTAKDNSHTSLTNTYDRNSTSVEVTVTEKTTKNVTKTQENPIRPDFSEMTKSGTILGLDMDAARGRVHNRLAGISDNSDQTSDDSDLSPYMHVPPDGLPRTVYLLPPLNELFIEAKKARYIRKLRKPHMVLDEDDPERELNIDEIFRKT